MLLSPFLLIHPDTKTRMDLKLSSLMWYEISKQRLRYSGKWLGLCFFVPFFLHDSRTNPWPSNQVVKCDLRHPNSSCFQFQLLSHLPNGDETQVRGHIFLLQLWQIDEFSRPYISMGNLCCHSARPPCLFQSLEQLHAWKRRRRVIHWNPRIHRRTTERM